MATKRVRTSVAIRRATLSVFVATAMVVGQLVALAPSAFAASSGAPISALSLSLSSYASAASEVTYTADFSTSTAGGGWC